MALSGATLASTTIQGSGAVTADVTNSLSSVAVNNVTFTVNSGTTTVTGGTSSAASWINNAALTLNGTSLAAADLLSGTGTTYHWKARFSLAR